MSKKFIFGGIAAAVASAFALAAAPAGPSSGLKAGDMISAFHPTHVSGPLANTTNCFPCTYQKRPQVQVWVNNDNMDNVAKIGRSLEKAVASNSEKEFKAMIVMLSDPARVDATKAKAKEFATANGFKNIAVAVLPNNHEAVAAYKVNTGSDVRNTVFVYKDWTVTNTMVNLNGDAAGINSLNASINTIIQ